MTDGFLEREESRARDALASVAEPLGLTPPAHHGTPSGHAKSRAKPMPTQRAKMNQRIRDPWLAPPTFVRSRSWIRLPPRFSNQSVGGADDSTPFGRGG